MVKSLINFIRYFNVTLVKKHQRRKIFLLTCFINEICQNVVKITLLKKILRVCDLMDILRIVITFFQNLIEIFILFTATVNFQTSLKIKTTTRKVKICRLHFLIC